MTTLDELRAELAAIDRDLLALIARRQAVAQQIGHHQAGAGCRCATSGRSAT
jgi:chorismate mutase